MSLTKEVLFKIAKIIDNDFIGTDDTFSANRMVGYYYLTTNKCDWASFIRVYSDIYGSITKITRLGNDTESWQEITYATMQKINQYIETLKT